MDALAPGVTVDWAADLFQRFCLEVLASRMRADVAQSVDHAARVFRLLSEAVPNCGEIRATAIVRVLGIETMRRSQSLMSFLSGELSLDWGEVDDIVEADRLERLLRSSDNHSWSQDLRAFLAALRDRSRPPSTRTLYLYARAASGLLRTGVAGAADLRQEDVSRFLRRVPGQASSLAAFVRWQRTLPGAVALTLPKVRRLDARSADRALVASTRRLLVAAEGARSPSSGRALLAAVIGGLLGVPNRTVLCLRVGDADHDGICFYITLGGQRIRLPARVGVIWRRWVVGIPEDLAFPGRVVGRPASSGMVAYHRSTALQRPRAARLTGQNRRTVQRS